MKKILYLGNALNQGTARGMSLFSNRSVFLLFHFFSIGNTYIAKHLYSHLPFLLLAADKLIGVFVTYDIV